MDQRHDLNSSFFQPGPAKCIYYQRTRDYEHDPYPASRGFLELLWRECSPYLDANALSHAKENMAAVFWELYLAYSLKKLNINLVERSRTKKRQVGPDLHAENPGIWIEAIAPTPGCGDNALLEPPINEAYEMPISEFVLRLSAAFKEKAAVFRKYVDNKVIPASEPTIIAISGAVLPTKFSEQPIPRIVRALLGVGNQVLLLNRFTRDIMGTYLDPCNTTYNAKGSPIKTDVFLDPAYAHISAVLYSYCDWLNVPTDPGSDFVLVHNKLANNPLPTGWLNKGVEYWLNDEQSLKKKRYTVGEE